MSSMFRVVATLCLAGVVLAGPVAAETVYYVYPHAGVVPVDTKNLAPLPPPDKVLANKNITFNINYLDNGTGNGFASNSLGPARRAALESALSYVSEVLNITGTLDIQVEQSLNIGGGNFLATAGTFFFGTPGFTNGGTFQRLSSGVKPQAGLAEISVQVDFGHSYYTGNGAVPNNQVDLETVLLHEITHGLGFLSLSTNSGGSRIAPQVYANYDRFMVNRSGQFNLFSGNPPSFQGIPGDFVSQNLAFEGGNATTLYDQGVLPGIYAPPSFQVGSSLSHLDTGNIVGGSVMEHAINAGVKMRRYANVDLGVLRDLGYTSAVQPADGEGEGEGTGVLYCDLLSVFITSPSTDIILPVGATNTLLNLTSGLFTIANDGGCVAGTIEVSYSIGGIVQGSSTNSGAGFPITINLAAGTYTVVATATLQETGSTVTGQRSFSVVSVDADPEIGVDPNPPSGFAFGNVSDNGSADRTFTVMNVGGGTLTGQAVAAGAGFSIVGSANYSLLTGESATITVRFAPGGVGERSGTLTFNGDPNGLLQIVLSGIGVKTGFFGCGASTTGGPTSDLAILISTMLILIAASVYLRRRQSPS